MTESDRKDLGSDFSTTVERLTGDDHRLAGIVTRHGVPEVFRRPPTFATLVLIILEQQVSLDSAAAAFRRLADAAPIEPHAILGHGDGVLFEAGFSRQKMRYVRALASACVSGELELEAMSTQTDDEVRRALTALPGVGPWTADVFLLACLGRPDVWPTGDRALQVGAAEVLGLATVPTAAELEFLGEGWRPYRSTAAQLIWHHYLSVRGRRA
ncbi:MAG: DNA-3-methyladenine glycosylase 2 family protein [Acidimicrobiia bacterium]